MDMPDESMKVQRKRQCVRVSTTEHDVGNSPSEDEENAGGKTAQHLTQDHNIETTSLALTTQREDTLFPGSPPRSPKSQELLSQKAGSPNLQSMVNFHGEPAEENGNPSFCSVKVHIGSNEGVGQKRVVDFETRREIRREAPVDRASSFLLGLLGK